MTYLNDISDYIKYGKKQSYCPMTTAINQINSKETADLKDKIIKRSAKFGRVAVVTGLAIVSAPVAIASSIVAAPFSSLFYFVCSMKDNIKKYIKTPKQNRNLTKLLKKTRKNVLRSIAVFFITIAVLSVDITFLAMTFITHTKHMQECKNITGY